MTTLSEFSPSSGKSPAGTIDTNAEKFAEEYREFVRKVRLSRDSVKSCGKSNSNAKREVSLVSE